jgi:cytochrome c oxidase subunit 3
LSASAAHHNPYLAHQFEEIGQQQEAQTLGMWIFLATEVMFFGGLFVAFGVYHLHFPQTFVLASAQLSWVLGLINTAILISSSLTMALAVHAAQTGNKANQVKYLAATLAFAFAFLGVKTIEYTDKYKHHLVPGRNFHFNPEKSFGKKKDGGDHHAQAATLTAAGTPAYQIPAAVAGPALVPVPVAEGAVAGATASADAAPQIRKDIDHLGATGVLPRQPTVLGLASPAVHTGIAGKEDVQKHAQIFFVLYFCMTGLHGIHVVAGIVVIMWLLVRAMLGHFNPNNYMAVEITGLYWHFVDLIWIYLFPLLYLADRVALQHLH